MPLFRQYGPSLKLSSFPLYTSKTLKERKRLFEKIHGQYPDRYPIIVRIPERSVLPQPKRVKFIVPHDLTLADFLVKFRTNVSLPRECALFLFTVNPDGGNMTLPPLSLTFGQIHSQYAQEDGFLYFVVDTENVFG